eukprot:1875804-Amphidinium_carterae.3
MRPAAPCQPSWSEPHSTKPGLENQPRLGVSAACQDNRHSVQSGLRTQPCLGCAPAIRVWKSDHTRTFRTFVGSVWRTDCFVHHKTTELARITGRAASAQVLLSPTKGLLGLPGIPANGLDTAHQTHRRGQGARALH